MDKDESPYQNSLEIVNVVGSGDLSREIDLGVLCEDIGEEADYEAGESALFFRPRDYSGLVMVYRTGKYIVRGGESFDNLQQVNSIFLNQLADLGVISNNEEVPFVIKNIVFVGDIGEEVILEKLVIQLGLENTEFEPEQFPGLVYRPEEFSCVLLVFGSGKVVITGSSDKRESRKALEKLKSKI
jgi:transcription initiation factor TFIID TATA-box-binding protein